MIPLHRSGDRSGARGRGGGRAGEGERGAVGLLAAVSMLVVLAGGLFVLALVTDLAVTAARARTAADAAALAGAGSAPLLGGDGDVCAAAERAAAANGAVVTRCRALPGAAGVEVAVAVAPRSPLLSPLTGPVPARAAAALRPPR